MAEVILFALFLAVGLTLLGNMFPSLNLLSYLPGWSQVVDIVNYGFMFVEPSVFIACLLIVVMLEQANLLWAIAMWVLRIVKP